MQVRLQMQATLLVVPNQVVFYKSEVHIVGQAASSKWCAAAQLLMHLSCHLCLRK